MAYVLLEGYLCERCGYRWAIRTGDGTRPERDPKVCSNCKSPYWNMPRRVRLPEKRQAAKWQPRVQTV